MCVFNRDGKFVTSLILNISRLSSFHCFIHVSRTPYLPSSVCLYLALNLSPNQSLSVSLYLSEFRFRHVCSFSLSCVFCLLLYRWLCLAQVFCFASSKKCLFCRFFFFVWFCYSEMCCDIMSCVMACVMALSCTVCQVIAEPFLFMLSGHMEQIWYAPGHVLVS